MSVSSSSFALDLSERADAPHRAEPRRRREPIDRADAPLRARRDIGWREAPEENKKSRRNRSWREEMTNDSKDKREIEQVRANLLAELIKSRPEWAELRVVRHPDRDSYAIAVEIDGWYSSRASAEEMREHFMEAALNIGRTRGWIHPDTKREVGRS